MSSAVRSLRGRLPDGLGYCLGVFAATRAALLLLAIVSLGVRTPGEGVSVPGWPAPPMFAEPWWHRLVTAWERFDALWFLRIADSGYRLDDGSAAFPPGFPSVVRVVSFMLGDRPLGAGLLVANLAFLAALVAMYRLTREVRGESDARVAVATLAWFPTAYFTMMPYSESLFLLLVLGSFLSVQRGDWVRAGVLGALAATTRVVGIVMAPALAVEAWRAVRERGARAAAGPILAACIASLGTLGWLGWWWVTEGDPTIPLDAQASWQRTFMPPWVSVVDGIGKAIEALTFPSGGWWMIDALMVIIAIAGIAWITPKLRGSHAVYAWASLLLPLSAPFLSRPLLSLPRFVLVIFPMYWGLSALATRLRMPTWMLPVLGAFGMSFLASLTLAWGDVF